MNSESNTTQTFSIRKMSELEALLPGFSKIWKSIKADTHTGQRCPKSVTFTAAPSAFYLNDDECGRRFALNLETMELSSGRHVSGGEWACHAGTNNDQEVRAVPGNMAVISCAWNDYNRSFSIEVQVASLPATLPACAS